MLDSLGSERLGYAVVTGFGAMCRWLGDVARVSSLGGGHVDHVSIVVDYVSLAFVGSLSCEVVRSLEIRPIARLNTATCGGS